MNRVPSSLIDELASNLAPVQPLRLWQGVALVAFAAVATVLLVELLDGLWHGAFTGQASPEFFITNGMLALLGAAASFAVVKMASPRVGNSHEGARWSALMLAILPVTALVMLGISGFFGTVTSDMYGVDCFLAGSAFGLVTAGALTLWLRRGAPVSLNAAGTYTGIAAGAIGSFTYGLACPVDHIGHLGIWHVAPVVLSAIIGRFAIPPLVRW
ncbi:DUF1109 domain-containing protein [Qipengyuania aquimaris]|uniref:DUF1109 domain-containing protein n=1 Tax=Qipengyuania aquimaris TaxID=255984 RepID=A0A9Q3XCF1_9SPHN|nr:DUF1109 domain-containing protein [Qipengyuania aquimaris]MBY6216775.1 DUF1109 domain-containing protein [Qipengyuania aquimaris]